MTNTDSKIIWGHLLPASNNVLILLHKFWCVKWTTGSILPNDSSQPQHVIGVHRAVQGLTHVDSCRKTDGMLLNTPTQHTWHDTPHIRWVGGRTKQITCLQQYLIFVVILHQKPLRVKNQTLSKLRQLLSK